MRDYIKACRVLHSPIRWPVQVEIFYGDYVLQQIVYLIPRTKKTIRLHCNQNWFCMGGSCPHFIFFTCINTCIFDIAWKAGSGNMNILKKNSTCNNSEANSNNIRCDRLDVDYHKNIQKLNVFTRSLSLKWLSWRKLSLREEQILCNYFWRGDKWETH